MDIETLRTFIVLSGTKNFTRTSEQLYIAQSTVTNRISELEKELNLSLFSRNKRSVELTPEGEQFLIYAKKVIDLTDSSIPEISSFQKFENQLRIGSADSIYDGHLASIILEHQKRHPKDALKISIGMSSQLLEQLQNDVLDVIFTYLPLNKSHYHCEIFRQDTMVLVTDIHNEKYINGIRKQELQKEVYLMCNFALQDVGQFIRSIFPKYQSFSLEIDDCSKIVPFLIGQDNYTFLPLDMATPYVASKQLRIIPLLDFETPVINCYIIGNKAKMKLWREIFLAV